MKNYSKKLLLVNAFGTLGYLTCLLLWGWVGIVYLPMLLTNEHIEGFLIPTPSEEPAPVAASPEMSPGIAIAALAVTVVVIILTVIVLLRAPVTIARTGKAVTTKAAGSALPLVTKGRPLPKAEKRKLTVQLIKLMKLLLVLLPVALGFLGMIFEPPLPFDLVMFVSSTLAFIALLWFIAQYIFANILGTKPEKLV